MCRADLPVRRGLAVSRGLLDQTPGLYLEEELVRCRCWLPSLIIEEVPQLNHYTIVLHPSGAARVAVSVGTVS
jgi:hypothetical protein